jgi:hypothetical protein
LIGVNGIAQIPNNLEQAATTICFTIGDLEQVGYFTIAVKEPDFAVFSDCPDPIHSN